MKNNCQAVQLPVQLPAQLAVQLAAQLAAQLAERTKMDQNKTSRFCKNFHDF